MHRQMHADIRRRRLLLHRKVFWKVLPEGLVAAEMPKTAVVAPVGVAGRGLASRPVELAAPVLDAAAGARAAY